MATNDSVAYYLAFNPVPEDRECFSSLTEVLQGVQDFGYVAGLASTVGGGSSTTPQTNNQIAALTARVQTLEGELEELNTQLPDRRVAATRVGPLTGDSTQVLTWTPAFETTNYEVRVTIIGAAAHPGAYYGWRVVDQSTTSAVISFDNLPAGSYFSAVVETLE